MKLRTDFVTNSSSSSFATLHINSPILAELLLEFNDEMEELGISLSANEVDSDSWPGEIPDSLEGTPDCILSGLSEAWPYDDNESYRTLESVLQNRKNDIIESIESVDWSYSSCDTGDFLYWNADTPFDLANHLEIIGWDDPSSEPSAHFNEARFSFDKSTGKSEFTINEWYE